jgi:hypothetical protein
LDSKVIAHAYVNPLTALSLREKLNRLSEKFEAPNKRALVVFLGADSNFGTIFMRLV